MDSGAENPTLQSNARSLKPLYCQAVGLGHGSMQFLVVGFKILKAELKRLCSASALAAFWPRSSRQVARGLSH